MSTPTKTQPAAPKPPAAKAAPAKAAGEKAERTRNTKPAMDFSKITATDVAPVASTRSSLLDGSPFPAWMKELNDARVAGTPKAKSVTVPEAAADQVVYLIRKSAERVGCGVSVVAAEPNSGNVTITFQARKRKESKKNKSAAETTPAQPTATAENAAQ